MRNFTPECTLPPNGTYSGYVHGVNTRSTLEIVWSCIGIIILCTWSILHLDLPADVVSKGFRQWICKHIYLLWRKVFWMGLKLFSPEFAATGCARKIFATRFNSAMLERLAHLDGVPWSLKHTILVDMGGIALRFLPTSAESEVILLSDLSTTPTENTPKVPSFVRKFCAKQDLLLGKCGKIPWNLLKCHVKYASDMGNGVQPSTRSGSQKELVFSEADVAALAGNIWILDSKQLAIARKRGIITEMPNIKEEAIDDKSKSDGLVKIIALIQVLWLVVQLIVRKIDGLHFTQLEITTVAFAATAVIIYSIDFIKPKDVNVPFYIDVKEAVEYDDFVAIAEAAPFAYMQGKRYYMPTSTLHDLIDYEEVDAISKTKNKATGNTATGNTVTGNTATGNAVTGNTATGTPETKIPDIADLEGKSQESIRLLNGQKNECLFYTDPKNKGKKCETCSQWDIFMSNKRSEKNRCCLRKFYKLSPKAADIYSLLIGFASATSFGGVHLFAWNSDFPTDVERLLWRISALMTIVLPYIYIGTHIPHIGSTVAEIRKQKKTLMNFFLGCIAICYIPCRLFLVTESFRALYFLPSEAFKATPAVMSIPHLG